jgi:non-ribosomal peptide synthetase component F
MQATPATAILGDTRWSGRPGLTVLCGGEALAPELAQTLRARCGKVWNMYGPSETAIYSVVHPVEATSAIVPIGRPVANTRVYVLDRGLEPVPVGVAGELYIGGAGVARGYLGRADLTAERFLPDPFSGEPGARLYRTGDLAWFRKDGTLEYLGRADDQEDPGLPDRAGQVETALRRHPTVRTAVDPRGEGWRQAPRRRVAADAAGLRARSWGVSSPAAFQFMVSLRFVGLKALP